MKPPSDYSSKYRTVAVFLTLLKIIINTAWSTTSAVTSAL